MPEAHLFLTNTPNVKKTRCTQRRLMRVIFCPKFNKQGGWPREKAQQLLLAGLVLGSIWEKARTKDGL
jgi:hypothetical protein